LAVGVVAPARGVSIREDDAIEGSLVTLTLMGANGLFPGRKVDFEPSSVLGALEAICAVHCMVLENDAVLVRLTSGNMDWPIAIGGWECDVSDLIREASIIITILTPHLSVVQDSTHITLACESGH
jgi:hypothetical protein